MLRCDEARSLRMKENYILFSSIVNEKKLNGRDTKVLLSFVLIHLISPGKRADSSQTKNS